MVLFDILVRKDTPLHRVDPRVKIISAILLTFFAFVSSNLLVLVALVIILQVMIFSTSVGWRTYSSTIWLVARLAILFVLLWPFFDQAGEPILLDLPIYKVTLPALLDSLVVAFRILLIASGWLLLMFTTPHSKLVRGMVKLGLPYDIGLSITIALRYIPNFIGTISQIKDAQLSRGFDMDKGGPFRRARNYIPVLIPTVAIALRTAEELSSVLVCRGYGGSVKRTYLKEIHLRGVDTLAVASVIVLFSLAIVSRIIWGLPI
ncbi:MAG: energy-coupling factor transporter transmembrane protein EcfT [Thermoplasmata archaeon]|nr:energy-coupling factor transporter transmembrane protein EcfT [Thermoplasmata archaeon]